MEAAISISREISARNLALIADDMFEFYMDIIGIDYYRDCQHQCSPLEFIGMAMAEPEDTLH